jgi:hypothetical protein
MGIKNLDFARLILSCLLQAAGFLCYPYLKPGLKPTKNLNFKFSNLKK